MQWRMEVDYQCEVRHGSIFGTWRGDRSYDDSYEGVEGMIADVKKFLKENYAEVSIHSREWESWRRVPCMTMAARRTWDGNKETYTFLVREIDADGISFRRHDNVPLTAKNVKAWILTALERQRDMVRAEEAKAEEAAAATA